MIIPSLCCQYLIRVLSLIMFLSPAPGAVIIEYLLSVTMIATGEVGMLNMVKKKCYFLLQVTGVMVKNLTDCAIVEGLAMGAQYTVTVLVRTTFGDSLPSPALLV